MTETIHWQYEIKELNSDVNNSNNINTNISTQIIENQKRPQHMTKEIQVLAWDRHSNVVGLNQ